ncbi:hypothetical protein [Dongia sp.]|uniref:hypothetical protein n=1 Tax=Dongia sp. TaxID=1977262 RepID=UPI0037523A69
MAMDGNAAGGPPRFAVGTVISTGLGLLLANIWRFLGIILAVALPAAVVLVLLAAVLQLSEPLASGGRAPQVLALLVVAVFAILAYLLILNAVTFGALQGLRGRKVEIGASLANGLAALPRAFVAGLIFAAAGGAVGFMVVSIGGAMAMGGGFVGGLLAGLALMVVIFYLIVLFWVFLPAIVVERAGPIACFIRSAALTKGYRWRILGILLLVVVANIGVALLIKLLALVGAPAASVVLDQLSNLFFLALSAVLSAVGYSLIRAEKEGVATDDLAGVFD